MTDVSHERRTAGTGGTMGRWVKEHGLLLANIGLFVIFFGGMILSGANTYSDEQLAHGEPAVTVLQYLGTGSFLEATFENWESEFLQMGMYVILTVFLFQKGSSESKPMGRTAPQDEDPRHAKHQGIHAVARAARRRGAQALRTLSLDHVLPAVPRLLHPARGRRHGRLQQ